jgi:hyperosmotically inducible protein
MKTFTHILLALVMTATLAACQSTTGQTVGRYTDDTTITTKVKSKLAADRLSNLSRVDVVTTNGTVHLMGVVDNADQKRQAGMLAAQVEGVKRVDNDIQIAATSSTGGGQTAGEYLDDTAITTKVKSRLAADRMANLTRINVQTINGTVHLQGTVDTADQKRHAETLAAQVEGVKRVDNDLEIFGRP